ncbi:MAG TPA: protein kinase [Pyrinomonadaceae bacterium]
MPHCPQCGTSAGPEDRFCGDCGTPLPVSAPAAPDPAPPQDPPARAAADAHADAPGGEPAPAAEATGEIADEPAPPAAHAAAAGAAAAPARAASAAPESGDAAAATGESEGVGTGAAEDQSVSGRVGADADERAGAGAGERAGADTGERADTSEGAGGRVAPAAPTSAAGEAWPTGAARTVRGGSTGGRARAATKQLEPGTVLYARYEIVRRVGGGGMGAVYLARDKNLGDQPRAVKEMIQANIDETQHEKAVNDFKRESMLLAALEHPSIPTIYDYFYDERAARFYLVMKYISGGDLLARLRNAQAGRLDEKTVADWGVQAADVLHYLHSRNPPIIYRDLKPANLMLDGNTGRVMLIDFGIARWVQKEEKGVTAVGTMGYAPPELFSGKVVPASDVYSLGATMFHLLTGADPQDNPLLIFDFTKHPRPRQLAPALSNEMEAILMRAVEYKPEDRFRTAGEMRDALATHLERLRAGQVTYGVPHAPDASGPKTMQVEMVYCGFCGGRIAADDLYCAHCGQRQPLAVASAALRTARATAKLVVMGTTELDSSYQLHKESSLVGRTDPNSNIFPEVDLSRFDPHTKVSRRHARIFRKGDVYLVEDLGSVNGTVVNDTLRLAPHQPRALESGDKLRLGETTLHFLIG